MLALGVLFLGTVLATLVAVQKECNMTEHRLGDVDLSETFRINFTVTTVADWNKTSTLGGGVFGWKHPNGAHLSLSANILRTHSVYVMRAKNSNDTTPMLASAEMAPGTTYHMVLEWSNVTKRLLWTVDGEVKGNETSEFGFGQTHSTRRLCHGFWHKVEGWRGRVRFHALDVLPHDNNHTTHHNPQHETHHSDSKGSATVLKSTEKARSKSKKSDDYTNAVFLSLLVVTPAALCAIATALFLYLKCQRLEYGKLATPTASENSFSAQILHKKRLCGVVPRRPNLCGFRIPFLTSSTDKSSEEKGLYPQRP